MSVLPVYKESAPQTCSTYIMPEEGTKSPGTVDLGSCELP